MNRIIKIFIGILFLFSGIAKSLDTAHFSDLISRYGFGWARHMAPFITGIEIILGLCILLNIAPRFTAVIIFFITFLFTVLFANAYFNRGITDCGCMGSWIHVPAYVSFIRNLLIMAGCVWLWKTEQPDKIQKVLTKSWIVFIVGGVGLCLAGSTLGQPLIFQNKIMQSRQIDSRQFFNDFNQYIPKKGFCEFFFFSPGCFHCWNATENIKSIRDIPEFRDLKGITFREMSDTDYVVKMRPNFPIIKISGQKLFRLVHSVPVLVVVKDGVIKRKFEGAKIPCGPVLKRILNGGE